MPARERLQASFRRAEADHLVDQDDRRKSLSNQLLGLGRLRTFRLNARIGQARHFELSKAHAADKRFPLDGREPEHGSVWVFRITEHDSTVHKRDFNTTASLATRTPPPSRAWYVHITSHLLTRTEVFLSRCYELGRIGRRERCSAKVVEQDIVLAHRPGVLDV